VIKSAESKVISFVVLEKSSLVNRMSSGFAFYQKGSGFGESQVGLHTAIASRLGI
jgi:hypothetical protein